MLGSLCRRATAELVAPRASRLVPQFGAPLVATARRGLRPSAPVAHGDFEWQDPEDPADVVRFFFIDRTSQRHEVSGKVGDNLLYLCHRLRDHHEAGEALALEGACEASLACSTCHVIVSSEHYDTLDEASEEEEDMLDLATCLTATSRLGCQIILSKELEGMVVTLPAYSRKCAPVGREPGIRWLPHGRRAGTPARTPACAPGSRPRRNGFCGCLVDSTCDTLACCSCS